MSAMLQSRLLGILRRELDSQNFQLSLYGRQQIEQLVGHGITRMRINNVDDHAGYVIRAERNLRSLIKYFCDYSRDVGSFPTLSNSAFITALNACPSFWPYRSSE